jgi:hypothetical protein
MKNFKQIAFGLLVGALAIGFSAFTSTTKAKHTKASGLYWFSISGNRTPLQNVPQANATFIQQSDNAPTGDCTEGSAHQCVSGFAQSKVNTSTDQLNGTQTPDDVDQLKN